ncbi:hypothetical protein [Pseudoalteromonas rhizosphaerae]|uniref:hypothetical protein n=1 Tax=Pseudoalteromonas rhizosphaerae TaxID=2518973 RepID=UPI00123104F2|nr:hypothetical protein [Pseudoalteromonas rhizosphaerae]
MSLYQQEFGQGFKLDFNLKDHPYLIDKSWHNDQCPSFYDNPPIFNGGELYYVLWVDYADIDQREEDTPKYVIIEANNEGTNEEPEVYAGNGEIVFECGDYTELKLFLKVMQNNKPPH